MPTPTRSPPYGRSGCAPPGSVDPIMPVAAQVLHHAHAQPDRPALYGPHSALDYAGLARRVRDGARRLAALGAKPGTLVAISLPDPVEQLVAVLAADLAGATPLLCDHGWTPDRREQIMRAVPVGLHLAEPLSMPTEASMAAVGGGGVARREQVAPAVPADPRLGEPSSSACGQPMVAVGPRENADVAHVPSDGFAPRPDDRAWANFSSGSTGRPRAVIRTRASWTDSFPHLNKLAEIGPGDVMLVPGPLVSSLYGFAAVHALSTGAAALVPGRWSPEALPRHLRLATAVHLVPHHLPVVLEALAEVPEPSRTLRTAIVGGAGLPADVRAAAERHGVRVVAYYGATELSFVAVDADGSGLRPFPDVEIEVRTPPRGGLGEVWVRSPWVSAGYVAGARGPLRVDAHGWMTVGDLAEPYRPGESLRVRGRGDGAIQTGGATVVPEDVEAVLKQAPGVSDVVVIGSPHPRLGAVVTAVIEIGNATDTGDTGDTGDAAAPSRAALEAIARGGLDPAQRPRRWYALPALPRTPTGKPARGLIASRLADGDPELRRLV
ncbi:class I adenylate-forming enzyme family protein [Thermopolyspora sp. NPDC052614]|uniref:class I adenylate-forming enzyme family protein n=1 Tax=Thermopolyspora sp. NPDC052614 TaxID=3155682 RepID=UPI0034229375